MEIHVENVQLVNSFIVYYTVFIARAILMPDWNEMIL